MRTLLEDGILKAARGLTTLEDVVRVVAADDTVAEREEVTKQKVDAPSFPSVDTTVSERQPEIEMSETASPVLVRTDKPDDFSGKRRVLVVEDSPTIASVVKYFLELEGFEVLVAKDGKLGLKAAKRDRPDVVVTDYNMPGMDGLALVKALRAGAATRDMAVVMLTSEPGVENETQALEAGVDDYILKPVEPRRLAARVKAALAHAEGRRSVVVDEPGI
jgi:PleD family two-component response regulator